MPHKNLQSHDGQDGTARGGSGVDRQKCPEGFVFDRKQGKCISKKDNRITTDTKTGEVLSVLTNEEAANLEEIRKKGGRPISKAVRDELAILDGTTTRAQIQEGEKNLARKEEAEATLKRLQKTGEQPTTQQEPITQEGDRGALDIAKDLAFGNVFETDPITGEARIDPNTGQPIKVLADTLPIGIGSLAAIPSFLSKFSKAAKIAERSKGILNASNKLKTIVGKMGTITKLVIGGGIAKLANDLLTANIRNLEGEVSKAGEQLTKIPEAASLGFSLDENGKLFEYTPELALEEIELVEQSLFEAEEALQVVSIGNTVLKISGRHKKALLEVEKQQREITVARGKVLRTIAVPSESLEGTRDFFRELDLE